ncbi:hypothetical protein FB451DRAFT_1370091 [Mycena latifolia]|nr:hypothetical protein FB451DRAFT_1370091 [Mycena latifolia]
MKRECKTGPNIWHTFAAIGPSLTRNRSFMGRCAKHLMVANHPFANQSSVHKCSATPQFPVELGKGREASEAALEVLEVLSFLKLFSFSSVQPGTREYDTICEPQVWEASSGLRHDLRHLL